jgi:hypothetical protein
MPICPGRASVVADVVHHGEDLVAGGILAQAAAELLQPEDERLGGSQDQDGAWCRYVSRMEAGRTGGNDLTIGAVPIGVIPERRVAAVVGSFRDHKADATRGIRDIASVAWHQVDVQMRDRLTGGGALVDADVVPIGVVLRVNSLANEVQELEQGKALIGGGGGQVRDVTPRHDGGVAGGDGEPVPEGAGQWGLVDEEILRWMAEGAGVGGLGMGGVAARRRRNPMAVALDR